MQRRRHRIAARGAIGVFTLGTLFQFGGCSIPDVTIPTTLSGRDFLVTLIRGLLLTPIDQAITDAVNNAFQEEDDD